MKGPLQRVMPGQHPTLDHAAEVNKIIDEINALANTTVAPKSGGAFKRARTGHVIDLTPITTKLAELEEAQGGLLDALKDKLGIRAECNANGTLTVEIYIKD